MRKVITIVLLIFTFPVFAQLDAGLLLYYPLNGSADDDSGNGFNGTLFGNPTLTTDRFGNLDSAYHFDGMDDYLQFPNLTELKPVLPVSFSFWIQYDNDDYRNQVVFNTSYEENHATSVVFNAQSETNKYVINFADGSYAYSAETRRSYVSNAVIDTGIWHFVSIVVNTASDMQIFIDCMESGGVYSGNGGDLEYSLYPGCIGRHDRSLTLPTDYFMGSIDDFRYWAKALTAKDMETLCNSSLAVSEPIVDSLTIYPNPLSDVLHIEANEGQFEWIEIYNSIGQQLYSRKFASDIDVSNFISGVYLIRISNNRQEIVKRFIVR